MADELTRALLDQLIEKYGQPSAPQPDRADFLRSEKDTRPYDDTWQRHTFFPIGVNGYNNTPPGRSYGPAQPNRDTFPSLSMPGMIHDTIQGFHHFGDMIRGDQPVTYLDETGRERPTPEAMGSVNALVGATMIGGSAATKPQGSAGVFAGREAKTANLPALKRAEQMSADGFMRNDIRSETGWFKDAGGNWRFEIPDTAAKKTGGTGRLGDILDHPDLYAAYPQLRQLPVSGLPSNAPQNALGAYLPKNDEAGFIRRLLGNADPKMNLAKSADKGTVIHETQHAIDDIEGALKSLDRKNPYASASYADAPFEKTARAAQNRADMTPQQLADTAPWIGDWSKGVAKPTSSSGGMSAVPGISLDKRTVMDVLPERQALDDLMSEIIGKPSDRYHEAFVNGMKGPQFTPETAQMHDLLKAGAESIATRDPNGPWARYAPTVDAYAAKAQRLGHNGGPATMEWESSPFLYSNSSKEGGIVGMSVDRALTPAEQFSNSRLVNGIASDGATSFTGLPAEYGWMDRALGEMNRADLRLNGNMPTKRDFFPGNDGFTRFKPDGSKFTTYSNSSSEAGTANVLASQGRKLDPLGYYSKLDEVLGAFRPTDTVTAQTLAQRGVKASELQARGLDGLLERGGTKVQDLIAKATEPVGLNESVYRPRTKDFEQFEPGTGPSKWNPYSLDKGSNPTYRETVLSLPKGALNSETPQWKAFASEMRGKYGDDWWTQLEGQDSARRIEMSRGNAETPDFRQHHFSSEPNVIAHMRTSMQKDSAGRPVFHIDELQSDWGQKIRDGGVRDEAKIASLTEALEKERTAARAQSERVSQWSKDRQAELDNAVTIDDALKVQRKYATMPDDMKASRWDNVKRLEAELKTASITGSPGHPLVNTSDQWQTTALRRALRQAVDSNADAVAIPSGNTVHGYGMGTEGGAASQSGVQYAYDKMYPNVLAKELAKLDPTIKRQLETLAGHESKGPFSYFPITDTARAKIKEGLPLFANADEKTGIAGISTSNSNKTFPMEESARRKISFAPGGPEEAFIRDNYKDMTLDKLSERLGYSQPVLRREIGPILDRLGIDKRTWSPIPQEKVDFVRSKMFDRASNKEIVSAYAETFPDASPLKINDIGTIRAAMKRRGLDVTDRTPPKVLNAPVDELPDVHRSMIEMRQKGMSYGDIARELNISRSSVAGGIDRLRKSGHVILTNASSPTGALASQSSQSDRDTIALILQRMGVQ